MQHAAAESLYHCLLEMGEQDSNPVLEVIHNKTSIQLEKKYPKEHLHFNAGGWRAYYHTHKNSTDIDHFFTAEHGHFHIFVQTDETGDTWSHLVALSMDDVGQPLRWFMVNHWVTGETWQDTGVLSKKLDTIPFQQQKSILEEWLLSMLAVYRSEIINLLHKRDLALGLKTDNSQLQNRALYLLAEETINLQNKLEQIFITK